MVVLTGSPHRKGSTALLAERFICGAEEAGHEVFRFDAAFGHVGPCLACNHCRSEAGRCVQRDAMDGIYPHLLEADCVVFVSPIYYHGMTAQVKAVVDRFYGIDAQLRSRSRKAVLIAAAADTDARVFESVQAEFEGNLRYLGWQEAGRILALACVDRAAVERTDFPEQAYQLGRGL